MQISIIIDRLNEIGIYKYLGYKRHFLCLTYVLFMSNHKLILGNITLTRAHLHHDITSGSATASISGFQSFDYDRTKDIIQVTHRAHKVKYLCFLLYVPNPDNIIALTLRNVNKSIMEETTFSFIFLAINQYIL